MTMTPERFNECLTLIGWTGRGLAAHLGVHETRTRRWGSGRYPIPQTIAAWLESLANHHERHRLPDGWNVATGDDA